MSQIELEKNDSYEKRFFSALKDSIKNEYFATWFNNAKIIRVTDEELILSVESMFSRDWIKKKYLGILEEVSKFVDGLERKVLLTVHESNVQLENELSSQAGHINNDHDGHGPKIPEPRTIVSGTPLIPSLTFENFVVGLSNNLPYAAARAVAERPGHAYNPLFIHGAVGLGKTHLLQAICHQIISDRKPLRIRYISCETFINQFISAIQGGDLEPFRNAYRSPDMLLIDDIHLLAHKERTQDEFFHTFNHLVNAGKQIVFSSDSPPHEIPTLKERLVSRFKMGLVGEIELPDLETRIAIVKQKARIKGFEFPNDVAVFIAENVKTNIRELEGAVTEVIGYSTLNGNVPINIELAKLALKPLISPSLLRRSTTMQDIFQIVQNYFNVTLKELQSKKRTHTVSSARHVVMYLARRHTSHSLQEIGGYLGGKDHSSVLYALKKVEEMKMKEPGFKETLEKIERDLLGNNKR